MDNQNTISANTGVSIGKLILVAVLVAIVFGGGAYFLASKIAKKDNDNLRNQISQLQSQSDNAQSTSSSSSTVPTVPTFDASSWQTFSSKNTASGPYEEFSFMLKIPPTWVSGDKSSCMYPMPKKFLDDRTDVRECGPLSAQSDNATVADFAKSLNNGTAVSLQPVTLTNGTKGQFGYLKVKGENIAAYFFEKDGHVIEFSLPAVGDEYYNETLQVINTFEFIK